METCSLSKYAGFTGVRLGWTVVPEALKFADGTPVIQDFNRVMSTCFNGASAIAQAGAIACMSDKVQFQHRVVHNTSQVPPFPTTPVQGISV